MDLDMYKFVADMYEARTLKKKEMKTNRLLKQ